jgi:serine/threonine-protein kinase
MFEPGTVINGKYRVEGAIATGGMGIVLHATHLHLREPVAIKVLRPDTQARPESVARFMREARMTMRLRGEHVVRVFDVDLIDGRLPYIVMELLEGEDLAVRIARDGAVTPSVAKDWLEQLCAGVAQAHAIGIVHRDLKPANVFLTKDGVIKVLDFGVSKASAALFDESAVTAAGSDPKIPAAAAEAVDEEIDLTSTRTTLGSPRYMSPEQMRSARDVDERSDIWAIGAIAHEMLSGDPPFEGDDLEALRDAITTETPRALAAPERLRAIVDRCLAKDPRDRFATVAELRAALAGGRSKAPQRLAAIGAGAGLLVALAFAWPRTKEPAAQASTPAVTHVASAPAHEPQVIATPTATTTTTTTPIAAPTEPAPSMSTTTSTARRTPRATSSAKVTDDHLFDNPE